jgi:hypothetical protein
MSESITLPATPPTPSPAAPTGDTVPVPRERFNLGVAALKVLDGLLTSPDTRPNLEKMIKEKFPDAKFADSELFEARTKPIQERIDQERQAREALQAQIDEMKKAETDRLTAAEAAKKEAEDKKFEQNIANRLDAIKKKYGFQAEAMEAVWKRMQEQNSPDVESAAAFVSETTRKPPPLTGPNYLPQSVDMYGLQRQEDSYTLLHQNPWAYFDREVRDIVANPDKAN